MLTTSSVLSTHQHGNELPVSAFKGAEDGTFPQGSAAYEKRGIAVDVPVWNPDNCIQCNFCSYVCPHAVIRPVVMTEEEAAKAPAGTKVVDMTGMPGMKFAMTVSVLDCTGCGSCANVCPGMKGNKALTMESPGFPARAAERLRLWQQICTQKPEVAAKFKESTVKGSQFTTAAASSSPAPAQAAARLLTRSW